MTVHTRESLIDYILSTYQAGEKLAFLDVSQDFIINHLHTQGVDVSPTDLNAVLEKVQESLDEQDSQFSTCADLEEFVLRTYNVIQGA